MSYLWLHAPGNTHRVDAIFGQVGQDFADANLTYRKAAWGRPYFFVASIRFCKVGTTKPIAVTVRLKISIQVVEGDALDR